MSHSSELRSIKSTKLYLKLVILPTLFLIVIVMVSAVPVYGHTFSQNENSLFLTRMNQIHSQLQLVQNLLSTNTTSGGDNAKLAQTHTTQALSFLKEKDPVNNVTWTREISERNQRVANDLIRELTDLNGLVYQRASSGANFKGTLANESSSIQDNIFNLNGLVDEAISARIPKDIVNNSTNQALVLANMGSEIFYSYGQALGYPYAKLANMVATMNMSAMGGGSSNMNMNMQGMNMTQNMDNMNANGGKMPTMNNMANIQNQSQYQNAQAYVKQAQEIVSKYLTSSNSTNKNTVPNASTQISKVLSQLKTAIDDKGSFDTVMNLIHVQLHPTLISDYGLKLVAPSPSK
ncbi:MAG TPA: hypothetical protein VH500_00560 [Nitrososphaeraceae archaeon]